MWKDVSKKVGERKIVRIVRRTELCRPAQLTSSWRRHDGAASSWRGAFHDRHGRHCRPVRAAWPVKSRQMSIKSGPKLISLEKWKILTPLPNCPKMWQFGENNCFHRLRKVGQSAINRPIWSHWLECFAITRLCVRIPLQLQDKWGQLCQN